ncbi:MAG: response regulator transcription factor [Saccharofermentans sp.]|jgi:DNA-binding response OmpR family regulator|nr:response regulator transcription factor [Saccharofermentans sp.]
MKVLIAEDEIQTAKALKIILEQNKISTDIVHRGDDAWNYIKSGSYEVIVLDIMMPGMDGLEVLSRIRREHLNTPVLMLTARSEIEDRVNGLESGADDYLTKPYATSELIARIRALGRRSEVYTDNIKTAGDLILDGNRYEMRVKDRSVKVTNKEYQLLELFISYPGFVFSSEHLMDKIWGLDSESEIDVVWTHIGFIRKKLKNLNAGVEIRTVRGAGYSLEIIK